MFQDIRKFIELQTDLPSVVLTTDPIVNAECLNSYDALTIDEQNYYKNSNICLIGVSETN